MKQEDIETASREFSDLWHGNIIQTSDIYRKCDFEDGFRDGAEWRIESVWHKPNEEPLVKSSLLLIEHIDGEFELGYRFDPANIKRWAYVKDLIPDL